MNKNEKLKHSWIEDTQSFQRIAKINVESYETLSVFYDNMKKENIKFSKWNLTK